MRALHLHPFLLGLLVIGLLSACTSSADTELPPIAPVDSGGADVQVSTDTPGADADAHVEPDVGPDDAVLITGEMALDLVNPFIGTGGGGFGYSALTPAAQRPYGLVRLGPDTTQNGMHPPANHFSGYYFDDDHVRGFSHLHFVGTGVADYGNIRVLAHRSLDDADAKRWYTTLDKESETASPGYYSAQLPDEEVDVELTAADHSGFHRYTFAPEGSAYLTIDAGASVTDEDVLASQVEVAPGKVTGWATHRGPYTGRTNAFTVYFSITVEPAAAAAWIWADGLLDQDLTSVQGEQTGAVLRFDDLSEPIELRVGVSMVDLDAAEANRVAQLDGRTFEEVHAEARAAWADKLNRVRLRGADDTVNRIFYTALYNTYRMPSRFDGVDGRYRGLDAQVHETDGWIYYSDLSLWDTFRTLHPWLTLTDVDAQRNVLRSMVAMRADGGHFPRWPAALSYTNGMLGTWAEVLFAEGALKGIDGIDYAEAYVGAREPAMTKIVDHPFAGRSGITSYMELGYVSIEDTKESGSHTLEYAWGDFALANLAGHLGLDDDEAMFRARSGNFRNIYHAESGFFRGRHADGTFNLDEPVHRIYMGTGHFNEGSAWHWRFYALHDPAGLVDLFGGKEAFGDALEEFFSRSKLGSDGPVSTLLPDSFYWHGNEPSLHSALLFHAADRYDRLSHWIRQIQTRLYFDNPAGIPGNDDGGTLSAWYLFNALGLYPVAGSDLYFTSIPIVPYAEIDTANGTLIIDAPGAAPRNQTVTSVSLDAEVLDRAQLHHAELLGATLRFELE